MTVTPNDRSARCPVVVVLDDWEGALTRLVDWETIRAKAEVRIHRVPLRDAKLHAAVVDADVLILSRDRTRLDERLLERCRALRYVVFTGPRNAHIDYERVDKRGIVVSATEGGPGLESTCEHTWALILAAIRHLGRAANPHAAFDSAPPSLATVLSGERLGLIGCGRIGSRVAAVGTAFGMEVVTWSPRMTASRASDAGAVAVSLDTLLRTSKVISLHLVVSDSTVRVVDRDRLAVMRADALLVNTARADLVDYEALTEALAARRIAGAALDVFPSEPLGADDPLRQLDNVVLTPHQGYVSEPVMRAFAAGVRECLDAWLTGLPLPRPVRAFAPSHA